MAAQVSMETIRSSIRVYDLKHWKPAFLKAGGCHISVSVEFLNSRYLA
jgi:hypothetical protein